MVECQLPKLDVAGSIPVSRSILLLDTFFRTMISGGDPSVVSQHLIQ